MKNISAGARNARRLVALFGALTLSACAMETASGASAALAGDDPLLSFVNDQVETDFERLDLDCAIRSDAAENILRHRDGADGKPGVGQDDLFDSVQELDDMSMVGPWTMDRLRECADAFGYGSLWATTLDVAARGQSNAAIAAFDDGTAALFNRGIVFGDTGNEVVSWLRTYDGAGWSAPVRLDEGLPPYASSYGTEVRSVFDHYLLALPDGRLVAGLLGRYSTSVLNEDGSLYAVFLRVRDASGWGPWQRVTPVGRVFSPEITADASGRVWIAWDTANNLQAGTAHLASFDPTTGAVTAPETVAATAQASAFQKLDLVAGGGTVWVTYWADAGLFARGRAPDGSWGGPVRIGEHAHHASAWADGTLWVATDDDAGTRVHRLVGNGFVTDATLFVDEGYETDVELESTGYVGPAITARPNGGVAVAIGRHYHFERWVAPVSQDDRVDVVARERTSAGVWSSTQVVHAGATWQNASGAMASGGGSIWAAGANFEGVFAAQRTP